MSYGAAVGAIAGAGSNLRLQQAHTNHLAAQQAGITMIASSGDGGTGQGYPVANASFPASDPLVTASGGTNLFMSDTGVYQRETTWNDGFRYAVIVAGHSTVLPHGWSRHSPSCSRPTGTNSVNATTSRFESWTKTKTP
jgi:subtilase family serine protease